MSPTAPISVIDDIGRNVIIPAFPQRIISMAPSVTEILFALGLGERVVGSTYGSDYPPEALKIEKISEDRSFATMYSDQPFGPFYIDKMVKLKPDLVIMERSYDDWQLTWFHKVDEAGLNILVLWAKSFEDVLHDIDLVGKVTWSQENATKLVSVLEQRVNIVLEKVGGLSECDIPRVFAAGYYDGEHDPWIFGPGYHKPIHFVDEIIRKAGGINIADEIIRKGEINLTEDEKGFLPIDLGTVLRADPQVILAVVDPRPRYSTSTYESIMNDKRLLVTKALQDNAVYYLDMEPMVRPGPRLADSIEMLAEILHPELFG